MDVWQNHDSVWDFCFGQSEGAYFRAQHTLLQVCHLVGAVLEKDTAIIPWLGAWECSSEIRMDMRQRSRGVGGVK